jgi:hypothetical protein
MKISVFGEGPTEDQVHSKLAKLIGLTDRSKYFSSKGKDNLNAKVIETIGADLGVRSVRCLVLRDLDTHDGENEQSICQSITDTLRKELEKRSISLRSLNLILHPIYSHIYTLNIVELDFRLAIHIAAYRWNENFINSTTDDYLLELALKPNTVAKLSTKLGLAPERLSTKITNELPEILQSNGITLREAKNYLQIYAATIQFSSLTGFVSKMIENADEQDIRDVFQSLIVAFEFVGSE